MSAPENLPAVRVEDSSAPPAHVAPILKALGDAKVKLGDAKTPEDVESVRGKLSVLRAVVMAAMRDPGAAPEDVAHARRECEQLALEAAVKLGMMVPEPKAGGDPTPGVGSLAKQIGVSASTLRNYRDLAAAFRAKADEFMSIARDAINSGVSVPMERLIALVKPGKSKADDPPPARQPKWEPPKHDSRPKAPAAVEPSTPQHLAGAQTDPKGMAKTLFGGEPEKEKEPAPIHSVAAECLKHASAVEAALRFCALFSVEVNTPSLDAAVAEVKRIAATPACLRLVSTLREVAQEDGEVVKAEQERITKLHREAKAARKKSRAS